VPLPQTAGTVSPIIIEVAAVWVVLARGDKRMSTIGVEATPGTTPLTIRAGRGSPQRILADRPGAEAIRAECGGSAKGDVDELNQRSNVMANRKPKAAPVAGGDPEAEGCTEVLRITDPGTAADDVPSTVTRRSRASIPRITFVAVIPTVFHTHLFFAIEASRLARRRSHCESTGRHYHHFGAHRHDRLLRPGFETPG
jgi:hypothetical protein